MNFYLIVCLLVFSGMVRAQELVDVEDGGSYQCSISAEDTTRIAVRGDRIRHVYGSDQALSLHIDNDQGDVYIHPLPGMHTTELFIATEHAGTFALHLNIRNQEGDGLILVPKRMSMDHLQRQVWKSSDTRVDHIRQVIVALLNHESEVEEVQTALQHPWREVSVKAIKRIESHGLVGEVYLLRNETLKPLELKEAQFQQLVPNIRAVSLLDRHLEPSATTQLIVVRSDQP